MNNTQIIYSALTKSEIELPELELESIDSNCMMCGKVISRGVRFKKVLSGNFTDYEQCRFRQGTHICKECSTCIKTREIRTSSFVADKDNLYLLRKNDIESYLFNLSDYVENEFVIGLTKTFKKHNSFKCAVNQDTSSFYIQEEDVSYLFKVNEMKELYKLLNEAYLQFTKDELITGDYNLLGMRDFGLDKFVEYEEIFKKYRGSHQFNLLVHIMNSEKRNEYIKHKQQEERERKALEKKKEKELEKCKDNMKQLSLI